MGDRREPTVSDLEKARGLIKHPHPLHILEEWWCWLSVPGVSTLPSLNPKIEKKKKVLTWPDAKPPRKTFREESPPNSTECHN